MRLFKLVRMEGEWFQLLKHRLPCTHTEVTRLFDEFLATVESWKTLDFISALLRYRLIPEQIQEFIRKSPVNDLLPHSDASHTFEDDRIKSLLDMDVIAMCIRLSGILTNRGACRDLISRRGEEAQTLLNLFQTVSSYIHIISGHWQSISVAFRSAYITAPIERPICERLDKPVRTIGALSGMLSSQRCWTHREKPSRCWEIRRSLEG